MVADDVTDAFGDDGLHVVVEARPRDAPEVLECAHVPPNDGRGRHVETHVDEQGSACGEHHDERVERPILGAHRDRADVRPIHLGLLPIGHAQAQERLVMPWSQAELVNPPS